MNFDYNYFFFNIADRNTRKKDPTGYNTICVKDLENLENINVISYPLDYAPYAVRCLYYIHCKLNLPLKRLWYPFYFKNNFKIKRPLCFIVSGTYLSVDYLRYLKRKYPNAVFINIHRDLVSLWKKRHPEFTDETSAELFDYNFAYDKKEAENLGWFFFDEFESKIAVPKAENYPLSDVFFAGRAKERLPKLLKVYKILTAAGLHVNYYLTGVPERDREDLPGIEYAERSMPYSEMLYRTVNSRCILEINQENAVGYTSRFLEAVMYNKKLITNNLYIKNSKFYNEKYIKCFEKADEIDADFVKADEGKIDYNYNGEFSPIHLIRQIDEMLVSSKGGNKEK